jgi:hypothetical protein
MSIFRKPNGFWSWSRQRWSIGLLPDHLPKLCNLNHRFLHLNSVIPAINCNPQIRQHDYAIICCFPGSFKHPFQLGPEIAGLLTSHNFATLPVVVPVLVALNLQDEWTPFHLLFEASSPVLAFSDLPRALYS